MRTTLLILGAACVLFLLAALLFPSISDGPDYRSKTKNDVAQLSVAISAYKSEYGNYPTGNQIEILNTLKGANLKKIVFIELSEKQFDKNGYFVDQWGSPYQIDISDQEAKPKVWSSGKNKKDDKGAEHTDDVASWN